MRYQGGSIRRQRSTAVVERVVRNGGQSEVRNNIAPRTTIPLELKPSRLLGENMGGHVKK